MRNPPSHSDYGGSSSLATVENSAAISHHAKMCLTFGRTFEAIIHQKNEKIKEV
ncbi:MAG: hypothetical protein K9G26_00345 [Emcibacter sp.]|nr:hypothetical protein [Emcibacter sp.]